MEGRGFVEPLPYCVVKTVKKPLTFLHNFSNFFKKVSPGLKLFYIQLGRLFSEFTSDINLGNMEMLLCCMLVVVNWHCVYFFFNQ